MQLKFTCILFTPNKFWK